jgi:hypothetical protein
LLCTARPSQVLLIIKKENSHLTVTVSFLAGAEGLEPSARGFGVSLKEL